MRWKTVTSFSAKIGNELKTFRPGERVDLMNDKAAKLLLAGVISSTDLEGQEYEYITLLDRWWDPSTEDLPHKEIHELLDRLDKLYQELHRRGRKVPVRLPLER